MTVTTSGYFGSGISPHISDEAQFTKKEKKINT
jgi:hypothetical protein